MTIYLKGAAAKTAAIPVSEAEWQARVDLAACYRLIALFGMNDLIYNHATARVPDTTLVASPVQPAMHRETSIANAGRS